MGDGDQANQTLRFVPGHILSLELRSDRSGSIRSLPTNRRSIDACLAHHPAR